jgi:hypothetical protein
MHAFQSTAAQNSAQKGTIGFVNGKSEHTDITTYGSARDQSIHAVKKTFPESGCSEKCLEAQLNAYHRQYGINDGTPIKSVEEGYASQEATEAAETIVRNRSARIRQGVR